MSARPDAAFPPPKLECVYVLGLGLSGAAATRLLRRRGVEVIASDRRGGGELGIDDLAADSGVALSLLDAEPSLPSGVDAVITSPGVPLSHPLLARARGAGVPVAAEVELAFHYLDGTVVGITGSNGKSTTTAMTGVILAGAGIPAEVCGNIGKPLSAVVDGPPGRIFVVELSSFQLETTHRFRPYAAALLNISPDHLDRHGDLAGYIAAKRRIFRNQGPDDIAVLNADDPVVAATQVRSRKEFFSPKGIAADGFALRGDEISALAEAIPTALAPLENAMAAALLARAVGAPVSTIAPSLREFRGLPHRIQRIGEIAGVAYVDDSKGTNVAATARALEGFADRTVHLILGGRNKGADFAYLDAIVAQKARRIYLIGESAAAIERALGGRVAAVRAETLDVAVASAASAARAGDVVLLSPACASFDQFRDYIDRGEKFASLVRAMSSVGTRP